MGTAFHRDFVITRALNHEFKIHYSNFSKRETEQIESMKANYHKSLKWIKTKNLYLVLSIISALSISFYFPDYVSFFQGILLMYSVFCLMTSLSVEKQFKKQKENIESMGLILKNGIKN
jgi:hypothetical protein